jgi:hypothetical protein
MTNRIYYHDFSPIKVEKFLKSDVILDKRVENILKEVVLDGNSLYNVYSTITDYINNRATDDDLIKVYNVYRSVRGSVNNNLEDTYNETNKAETPPNSIESR